MAGNKSPLNAAEIKAVVRMPDLLRALGFNVNTRVRRCSCLIHSGRDRTAFGWDEDVFHCFSCRAAGDKLNLIQVVLKCGFRQALEYRAQLAGV